jgi:hypothetical protein
MTFLQTLRLWRGLTRLVLAALLLGALAPGISRVLAAQGGSPAAIEICTSQGMRWIQLSAPDPSHAEAPEQSPGLSAQSQCVFCLLVADRLGPPPAASVHFFKAESGLAPPDEQAFSFVTTTTIAARPRGPPYVA